MADKGLASGQNMDDLITIIVAVYNIEDYVARCIRSIINQTYHNINIIINDGSTDRSGEICDEYAKLDSRINVFHGYDKGLSHARNHGIDIAEGEYIAFVDGDDWIHPQMIEALHHVIQEHKADVAACGFERRNTAFAEKKFAMHNLTVSVLTREEAISDIEIPNVVAWNKLYKRSIFDDIRYPEGKLHEDEYVIHRIFWKCKRIAVIKEPFYFYVMREDSLVNSVTEKSVYDGLEALAERVAFAEEHQWTEVLDSVVKRYLDYTVDWYFLVGQTCQGTLKMVLQDSAKAMLTRHKNIHDAMKYQLFIHVPFLYRPFHIFTMRYGTLRFILGTWRRRLTRMGAGRKCSRNGI